MTAGVAPKVRPVAENADRVAMCISGVRDVHAMMPMLVVDLRNSAIADALVEHGAVTMTFGKRIEVTTPRSK